MKILSEKDQLERFEKEILESFDFIRDELDQLRDRQSRPFFGWFTSSTRRRMYYHRVKQLDKAKALLLEYALQMRERANQLRPEEEKIPNLPPPPKGRNLVGG